MTTPSLIFDRIDTLEKSILAKWNRKPGCTTDAELRRFSQAAGRRFARFAFPDDLVRSLSKLTDRIKKKHGKNNIEGQALVLLDEIRVIGTPSWGAKEVDVFLIFAPGSKEAEAKLTPEEWDTLLESWLALCIPYGVVASVNGEIISLDDLTATEYLDSDLLDLDHLSS